MNDWIDLTVSITKDYLVYPGDEKFEIKQTKTIENDGFNMSTLKLNMHIGTHIDFRSHALKLKSLEEIDFSNFIGKANVIKPNIVDNIISTKDIEEQYNQLEYRERILFLDLNYAARINTQKYYEPIYFEPKIFKFLNENNITILGADIPSFSYFNEEGLRMHKDLLGKNIYLIENLTNLNLLNNHFYFVGLPLKISGVEASLIRAVAKNLEK